MHRVCFTFAVLPTERAWVQGQLEAVRLLGAGSCGAVVLAQAPQAEGPPVLVAVKTLMVSPCAESACHVLRAEIELVKQLEGGNCLLVTRSCTWGLEVGRSSWLHF